jgi:hypothetical protein
LCYSQTKELYDLAFSNKDNFSLFKFFGGKIPRRFVIIDTTERWNPETFFLKGLDLKDPKVVEDLINEEHHPYTNSYLFIDKKLDSLISNDEKKYLSDLAERSVSTKTTLKGTKYRIADKFKKRKGLYFLITDPIYSSDKQFAFGQILIRRKEIFMGDKMDEYFIFLTIMFQKNKEEKWTQIGIKEHPIL